MLNWKRAEVSDIRMTQANPLIWRDMHLKLPTQLVDGRPKDPMTIGVKETPSFGPFIRLDTTPRVSRIAQVKLNQAPTCSNDYFFWQPALKSRFATVCWWFGQIQRSSKYSWWGVIIVDVIEYRKSGFSKSSQTVWFQHHLSHTKPRATSSSIPLIPNILKSVDVMVQKSGQHLGYWDV